MSPVRPASRMSTLPLTTRSSARLVTLMVESDRLRRSSGASKATSRAVSLTSTSRSAPSRYARPPDPVRVPPLTLAVRLVTVRRSPARSSRAFRPSATTRGSSSTTSTSESATTPARTGSSSVPVAETSSVARPSVRTASVKLAAAAVLKSPSTRTSTGRSPVSPTVPAAVRVPAEPERLKRSSDAWPPATRIVDGCCCARSRPRIETRSSGKVSAASSAARSGRAASPLTSTLTRPPRPSGAPGSVAGSRPTMAARKLAGPPRRGISTGSAGARSSGTVPVASIVAALQLACSCSSVARPPATRARTVRFVTPGPSCGVVNAPLSMASRTSGSTKSRLPRIVPVSCSDPLAVTGASAGA